MRWGSGGKAAFAAVAVFWSAAALGQGATRNVTVVSPPAEDRIEAENAAGVAIDILPADQFPIGSKVVFKVTAKKPGYLILVDVDAAGKVTQRYPNLYSMALPAGASENANLLEPGKTVAIPNPANPFAHFEYIAEAPAGPGMTNAPLADPQWSFAIKPYAIIP
jgi:hypothetical protein